MALKVYLSVESGGLKVLLTQESSQQKQAQFQKMHTIENDHNIQETT